MKSLMTLHVFLSGPIRPSELAVRKAVLSIRSEFPDAVVSLCTWKTTEDTSALQAEVDRYIEVDEPTNVPITVTTQTDNRPDCAVPGWPVTCYKMMYAVSVLCDAVAPADDDIIIRCRTDCIFRLREDHRREILRTAADGYRVWFAKMSGVLFNDWFGVSTYGLFKQGWKLSSIEEYNRILAGRYNQEDVIKTRLQREGIPLLPIDPSKAERFLLRSNGAGGIVEQFFGE